MLLAHIRPLLAQSSQPANNQYDVLIRNGLIYDGSGKAPQPGDVAMSESRKDLGVVHPRTFGNFARLLGKYVREEHVMPLEEAVRRLTSLPATNHKLPSRGLLRPDYFADVVIFDPATVADKATFTNPFQYAVGVQHMLINGKVVLKDGEHTNVFPGKVICGPGRIK